MPNPISGKGSDFKAAQTQPRPDQRMRVDSAALNRPWAYTSGVTGRAKCEGNKREAEFEPVPNMPCNEITQMLTARLTKLTFRLAREKWNE